MARRHIIGRLAGAAALTGGLALMFGATAGGSTASRIAFPTHLNAIDDNDGAGYTGTFPTSSTVQDFAATYVVPSISCSIKDNSPIESFFEMGSQSDIAAAALVLEGCEGLQPVYEAGLIDSSGEPFAVTPGDVLTVSLDVSPSTSEFAVTDVTSGAGESATASGFTASEIGVGIQGANSGGQVSPRFSRGLFSGVTLNGVALKLSHPVAHDQVSPTDRTQLKATPLYHNGESFTVTWASSAAAGGGTPPPPPIAK